MDPGLIYRMHLAVHRDEPTTPNSEEESHDSYQTPRPPPSQMEYAGMYLEITWMWSV